MAEDFKSSPLMTVTSDLQNWFQEPIKILKTWQMIQLDIQESQKMSYLYVFSSQHIKQFSLRCLMREDCSVLIWE